jgi:phage-related holin
MKSFFFSEPFLLLRGAMVFALGPINHQIYYLALAMVVDLIFGIQVALKEKDFKFSTMINKFGAKVSLYSLWVVLFHAFDKISGLPDTGRWALILMLVGLEIFSAIKNTSKLGYTALADALEKLYLGLNKPKGGTQNAEKPKKPAARKKKAAEAPTDDSDTV